jgi:uncharacterized protein DUF3800
VSALAWCAPPLHTTINLIPGLSGLPERLRGKRLIMAASKLEFYVDDSGNEPTGPIFFLAGFLSTVERWAAFSNEWDSALRLLPTLDYFKMTEAARLQEQFSRKKGWDETKRDDRLVTLIRIINKYAMLRVSVSIRHDLFEKYMRRVPAVERNLGTDSPYLLLFTQMISVALLFADQRGVKDPIDFIFDKQDGFEQEAHRQWPLYELALQTSPRGDLTKLLGDGPFFLDEKQRLPLQAADLYVWQARNHYVENHRLKNQTIIFPMNSTYRLLRPIPYFHRSIKEPELIRQYASLVQTGEMVKSNQPGLTLFDFIPDRRQRRKAHRATRRKPKKH